MFLICFTITSFLTFWEIEIFHLFACHFQFLLDLNPTFLRNKLLSKSYCQLLSYFVTTEIFQYARIVQFMCVFCSKCVNYYVLSSSKNRNPLIVVRQDLCVRVNKLASVFYASALLLLMRNLVTKLSKWLWNHEQQASGSTVNFDHITTQFFIN